MSKKMYLQSFVLLSSLCLGLIACQNKSGDGGGSAPVVPAYPQAGLALQFPRPYMATVTGFSRENCVIQNRQVSNLPEYCNLLRDEAFNNNCGREDRNTTSINYCGTPIPGASGTPVGPIDPNNPGNIQGGGLIIQCAAQGERESSSRFFSSYKTSYGSRIGWDQRAPKRLEIPGPSTRAYGKISARFEPGRGGRPATVEIVVKGYNGTIDASVKGFVGRDVVLDLDDSREGNRLTVQCAPIVKMVPPVSDYTMLNCEGRVSTDDKTVVDVKKQINLAEISSEERLVGRANSRLDEIILSASEGQKREDDRLSLAFNRIIGNKSLNGEANFSGAIEMKYSDNHSARNAKIEVKCLPSR